MSIRPPHTPHPDHRRVWLGLALAVFLDTLTPLVWKVGTMRLPGGLRPPDLVLATVAQPLFWVLIGLFIAQFLNWMAVLASADVSFAQPLTALSYVSVSLISSIFLDERFTALRGAGVGLILVGVWLIGLTPVRTTPHGVRNPQPTITAGGRP